LASRTASVAPQRFSGGMGGSGMSGGYGGGMGGRGSDSYGDMGMMSGMGAMPSSISSPMSPSFLSDNLIVKAFAKQTDQATWQIELLVTDADGQAVGDAEVAVSVLLPPAIQSVTIDNLSTLAALQNEYQQKIESFRQSQRSRSVTIGVIVIFGGMALAVVSVILVIMRLASGLRMFVMATVVGVSCVFVCMVMLRGQSGYEIASLKQSADSIPSISAADLHEPDDFPSGIVWQQSDLRTDAAGIVRFEMTLPENIAQTYYFVVEAVSQDGKTGVLRSWFNVISDQEE